MPNEQENNQELVENSAEVEPEIVARKEEGSPDPTNSTATSHQQVRISGPLPSSAEMARYAQIDPDFAHRIIVMAETEAKHRHKMDENLIEKESGDIKRGQNYALIIDEVHSRVTLPSGKVIRGEAGKTYKKKLLAKQAYQKRNGK